MLDYEKNYKDFKLIAGMDEAGRGPLAGPVVSACVIMEPNYKNDIINDSKKLTAKTREKLFDEIIHNSISYGVGIIDNNIIDQINILNATKKSMQTAFEKLTVKPDLLLIDAVNLNVNIRSEAIIKGDTLSFNIAAASIIAKVTRDKLMQEFDKIYPGYAFAKNKGYGTKEHITNLRKLGISKIHRKTFLKNLYNEQCKLW